MYSIVYTSFCKGCIQSAKFHVDYKLIKVRDVSTRSHLAIHLWFMGAISCLRCFSLKLYFCQQKLSASHKKPACILNPLREASMKHQTSGYGCNLIYAHILITGIFTMLHRSSILFSCWKALHLSASHRAWIWVYLICKGWHSQLCTLHMRRCVAVRRFCRFFRRKLVLCIVFFSNRSIHSRWKKHLACLKVALRHMS